MGERALYWLAGLIEGEGYIGFRQSHGYRHALLTVNMRDKDVVERAQTIGGGRVMGPYRASKNPDHNLIYRWRIENGPARDLLIRLRPLMGQRRGARIDEVLEVCRDERERGRQARNGRADQSQRAAGEDHMSGGR